MSRNGVALPLRGARFASLPLRQVAVSQLLSRDIPGPESFAEEFRLKARRLLLVIDGIQMRQFHDIFRRLRAPITTR